MMRFFLIFVLSALFGISSVLRVEAHSMLSAHVNFEHASHENTHEHAHSHEHHAEKDSPENAEHSHQLELSLLGQSAAVSVVHVGIQVIEKFIINREPLIFERAPAPRFYLLSIFRPPIA